MKPADKFWEYAEQVGQRFKCKFCKKNFPGGISRVKSHLSGVRGRDIAICLTVPEDVQAAAYLVLGIIDGTTTSTGNKRKTNSSSGSVGYDGEISSVREDSILQQTSIPRMLDKKDKDAVDMKVALCFFQNNIAFHVISTASFIEMCRAISDYGIGYAVPSYSTLRTKLVVNTRAAVELYVNVVKESWSVTGCTIMSDIWTDMKRRSFINVVAYSPKGAVFLKSVERSGEQNTGIFIREILLSVIEEIGPENVVQIVTDNASNYGLACNLIMAEHPHILTIKCAAHGVQLLFDDIHDTVEWVKNVFIKARKIYDYLYKHIIVLDLMRVHTNGKDLRKYSKTRFASHFLMLQSILDVEDGLRNLVASADWRNMAYSRGANAVVVKDTIQGTAFWEEGRELILGMEPLVRLLRLVDGDGSTSGYIYEAVHRARKFLQTRCLDDPVRYMTIWELFEDVQKALLYIGEKMIDITERGKFAEELLDYDGKHPKIFSFLSIAQMRSVHPRVWWEANGLLFVY